MGQGLWRNPPYKDTSVKALPKLDATLTALADPDRRRAVELLGQSPRRAGELADALGLAAPAMSRHLRILKQGGLVEETHPEFDARVRIYTLKEGGMADLKLWLSDTEKMWAAQLTAFKDHMSQKRK